MAAEPSKFTARLHSSNVSQRSMEGSTSRSRRRCCEDRISAGHLLQPGAGKVARVAGDQRHRRLRLVHNRGHEPRRYHGLLVAATRPPVGRYVLLSKLEETLIIKGQRIELDCNQYPGAVHPSGHRFLTHFRLDPWPVFTYEVDGIVLEKSGLMLHGENTTVVTYSLASPVKDVKLEVRPLVAFRDYHI